MTTEPKIATEQLEALDADHNDGSDENGQATDAPSIELSEDMEVMSPGQMLKEAREELSLSVDEVADRLKLRRQLIMDIEADNLDEKLNQTFAKGYLRSYARLVDVPEDQVFASVSYLENVQEQRLDLHTFSKHSKQRNSEGRLMRFTLILVLLIVAVAGYWWWDQNKATILGSDIDANTETQSQLSLPSNLSSEPSATELKASEPNSSSEEPSSQTLSKPQTEPTPLSATEPSSNDLKLVVGDENRAVNNEATEAEQSAIESGVELASDIEEQTAAALLAQQNAQGQASNPQSSNAASNNQLNFTFAQECWVEVRDASGKRLVVGVKQPGSSIELNGEAPYSVVLGTSKGVEINYLGNKVDLSQFSDGKVVRLKIPSNS
ncbi:cytoskeleton protein RodZ [Alginatibacterium sediminis]|nr:cytoskeleton protein RodZ [Alginatibacterium sediminis]